MSDQALEATEEQTPDPVAEAVAEVTDWEERLNAAAQAATQETLRERLGAEPEEPQEPEEEASDDASTEPPDEEPPQPEPTEEPSQTDAELEYARRVAAVLKARPDLAEAMVALERGDAVPVPREALERVQQPSEPEPETPVESDFWEDPEAKFRDIERRVKAWEAYQEQQTQAQRQAEDQQNLSLIEAVGEKFRSQHAELTDEQFFQQLVPTIAKTNLIRMMREEHPGDSRKAVEEAFEAAFRLRFSDLAQSKQIDKQVREQRRARRAGATAASPRSVQRTQEEPKTRQGRIAAMTEELREAMEANA